MQDSTDIGSAFGERTLGLPQQFLVADAIDIGDARPTIEGLHAPFIASLRPESRPRGRVCVHAATWGPLSVSSLSYGRPVDIEPADLGQALLVTTAVRGAVGLSAKGLAGPPISRPLGTVLAVTEDSPVFRYDADSEVIKLRLDRSRIDTLCWQLLGRKGPRPVRFKIGYFAGDQRWNHLLRYLVSSLGAGPEGSALPDSLARSTEEILILHLLTSHHHNYSDNLSQDSRRLTPRECRKACAHMLEHIHEQIALSDLARAAGCSIRTLSRGFSNALNTTPMRHLQELRLQHLRADLTQSGEAPVPIAEIAARWGFSHMGDFNRLYRRRFGETPSQTRAASRHAGECQNSDPSDAAEHAQRAFV